MPDLFDSNIPIVLFPFPTESPTMGKSIIMAPAPSLQSEITPLPTAVQRYFEVALYLLVVSGFATLISTGSLDLPAVLLVSVAILFRGYLLARRRTLLIPETWTTALTLGYVAFYLADYFVFSGVFVTATVHLVLFVMVVRLFSTKRDRDYYFLAVISFLMVLAAAVLTVNSAFLLAFAAFMLMAVVTCILMEMRRASAKATVRANSSSDDVAYRQMAFSLAGASPVLAFLILLGAAAIFFVLPRISSGYLSGFARSNQISTGFSDRVQLGQIGEIQQSNSLVMHIQIDGDRHGAYDLKWRGVTLNLFDGKTWFNPHAQHVVASLGSGRFLLSQPGARGGKLQPLESVQFIHYHVLMEPLVSNVFFLAPTATLLQGNYRLVSMDNGDAVFNLDPEHPISRYEAASDIAQPSPSQVRTAPDAYPPEILLNYLQLPRLDARVAPLARQISASADNNYDKATAIETYLRTKFGYTLQLPRAVARDPVANFLFERKQGHCEYFASSMAVMLRTLGIPSRVVNGFRTGEFNDLTSQYLVRASSAHSWVEAYFPGYGWIGFDPTPAAPAQMRTGWGRSLLYLDALASFWREWVINYDAGHQYNLGREATRNSVEWFQRTRNWARRHHEALLTAARRTQRTLSDSPVGWSIAGTVIMALLLLAANARRLWQALRSRQLAARPEKSPSLAATIWYERMTRMLARKGWRKSPAHTPKEFLTCIQDEAMRESVAKFTQHYESARFGGSAQDAQRLPELYEEISSAARR
jgi:protein-glutamine gamma-glutamyltransferase